MSDESVRGLEGGGFERHCAAVWGKEVGGSAVRVNSTKCLSGPGDRDSGGRASELIRFFL